MGLPFVAMVNPTSTQPINPMIVSKCITSSFFRIFAHYGSAMAECQTKTARYPCLFTSSQIVARELRFRQFDLPGSKCDPRRFRARNETPGVGNKTLLIVPDYLTGSLVGFDNGSPMRAAGEYFAIVQSNSCFLDKFLRHALLLVFL
jgi:hypothetical protein